MQRTTKCISYQSNLFELCVPSPIIAVQLCTSGDKTRLFIVSFVRLCVWCVVYYVIHELIDYHVYWKTKTAITAMIWINTMYLGIVCAVDPLFSLGDKSIYGQYNVNGMING